MKTQLSEIDVEAEAVPFSFELKKGGRELRPSPMGYVSDFKSLVFHLLEENDRFDSYCQYSVCTSLIEMHLHRLSMLEWHNGTIPFDEIWIKIGGDKGGSSFKISVQMVNVMKPNSVKNSAVFWMFEAPDSVCNELRLYYY